MIETSGDKPTFTYRWEIAYDKAKNRVTGTIRSGSKERRTISGRIQDNKIFVTDDGKRYLWGVIEGDSINGFGVMGRL